MKPIITYYGGKQRMAHNLVPMVPKHTCYVEPFAGGAAILFAKPKLDSSAYVEVINDTSSDLINMYRIIQAYPKEFSHLIKYTIFSREERRKANQILRREIEADKLWLAWAYFVSISQSFSCDLKSGWRTSSVKNEAYAWSNKKRRLKDIFTRFESVMVENLDFQTCIEKWDSPHTFFYCDPPYVGADQGHYAGFKEQDLVRLCNVLDACRGSFILSGYKNSIVGRYGWDFKMFNAYASSNGKGKIRGVDHGLVVDNSRVEYVWYRSRQGRLRPDI